MATSEFLIYCETCHRLYGCCKPSIKTCAVCKTHDCPLLPAPLWLDGRCAACRADHGVTAVDAVADTHWLQPQPPA